MIVYPSVPLYGDFLLADGINYSIHPDFRHLYEKDGRLGQVFYPAEQARSIGIKHKDESRGIITGTRTASFPEEEFHIRGKGYFADRKGVGRSYVQSDRPGSENSISLIRHVDWEYLETPEGGHNYDWTRHQEFRTTSSLRPAENGFELAEGLYVCPTVAAVEISREVLKRYKPLNKSFLYPGRVGQSVRLVPGFHRICTGLYDLKELYDRIDIGNRKTFVENYLKSLLAFSTMGARTIDYSDYPYIFYYSGGGLDTDLIVDDMGNMHLVDTETFGPLAIDFRHFEDKEKFLGKKITFKGKFSYLYLEGPKRSESYRSIFFNETFLLRGLGKIVHACQDIAPVMEGLGGIKNDNFARIELERDDVQGPKVPLGPKISFFVKICGAEFTMLDAIHTGTYLCPSKPV